jgi:hypothetical protein
MDITDDPSDPRLTRGADDMPVNQADAYLVLSKAEREKGFTRPLRYTYTHICCPRFPAESFSPATIREMAKTTMGPAIAETYARNPKFYGATYCVHCRMHRPVDEFEWPDGTVVGS